MPRAVQVASGTADAQAVAGSATLVGFSARENAGTAAAATVILRNGTAATDPIVAVIELAADSSQTEKIPAVDCPNGIYVDRVAGTSELVVYVL
jgi:hypothetical protein